MFGNGLRLVLLLGLLALGLFQLSAGSPFGWVMLFAALMLVVGHFRHGTLSAAHRAYATADFSRLRKLLAQITRPDLLRPQDRAQYEFLSGVISQQDGEHATALRQFSAALAGPLRTQDVRGMVYLHAAEVSLATGDVTAARSAAELARQHSQGQPTLDAISRLEQRLSS
jgi:hypothetical protein